MRGSAIAVTLLPECFRTSQRRGRTEILKQKCRTLNCNMRGSVAVGRAPGVCRAAAVTMGRTPCRLRPLLVYMKQEHMDKTADLGAGFRTAAHVGGRLFNKVADKVACEVWFGPLLRSRPQCRFAHHFFRASMRPTAGKGFALLTNTTPRTLSSYSRCCHRSWTSAFFYCKWT